MKRNYSFLVYHIHVLNTFLTKLNTLVVCTDLTTFVCTQNLVKDSTIQTSCLVNKGKVYSVFIKNTSLLTSARGDGSFNCNPITENLHYISMTHNASTLETFLSLQSISIPLRKADSGDDNTAQFQLDCSAIQSGGQQGRMDCIQQPGGSSDIRTVGTITHKINVKATDDSYQMTQQRMKEAEEERKGVR